MDENTPRPLFITGASRSGTSMTAGLFAQHGVWFGPCMAANPINPKGFYESQWLKQRWGETPASMRVDLWRGWLAAHQAPAAWAVKAGPEWWPVFREFDPVVVCCYRDEDRILASRKRAGFTPQTGPIQAAWRRMEEIPGTIDVHPDRFVAGDFAELLPAFEALGVPFDAEIARRWVDPGLWSGG